MKRFLQHTAIMFVVPLLIVFFVPACLTAQTAVKVITGTEDHSITLAEAVKLVQNFRANPVAGDLTAEAFSRSAILGILNAPDCAGIRIYHGRKDDGTIVLVIVGIDSGGRDMTAGPLDERGFPCPPFCDTTSGLGH